MTILQLFNAGAHALVNLICVLIEKLSQLSCNRIALILILLGCCNFGFAQDLNEPNNGFGMATNVNLVALTVEVEGTFNPVGDLDYYQFEVPRAGVVVANIVAPSNIAPRLFLYNPGREEVGRASSSANTPATLTQKVCEAGTYYILAREFQSNVSNPEAYGLTISLDTSDIYECNDEFSTAKVVSLNNTINATLHGNNDEDYYEIEVPKAGVVVANIVAPSNISPRLFLYAPSREQIGRASSSVGVPATLTQKVCEAGTYYLMARDFQSNVSNAEPYQLTVSFDTADIYECNDEFSTAKSINLNDTISATLRGNNDEDYYLLEVPQAGVVEANIVAPSNISPRLFLYGPGREEIGRGSSSLGTPANLLQKVCEAGTYYLMARDFQSNVSNSEPYQLAVSFDTSDIYECNDEFSTAKTLGVDDTIVATLRGNNDEDYYQIDVLTPGVFLAHIVAPSNIAPRLFLYNSGREEIARASGSSGSPATLLTTVCEVGTYYLMARDFQSNVSSPDPYQLTLYFNTADTYECNNDFANAKSVTLCDTVVGAIFPRGDQDYYTVPYKANDTLIIDFGDRSAGIGISLFGYDPNQNAVVLQQNQPGDPISLITQDSGSYFVQVTARNSNDFSQQPYSLIFQTTDGCTTTSTNEFLTKGSLRLYPNPAGDEVTVAVSSAIRNSKLELSVFGLDGRLLKRIRGLSDGQLLNISSLPTGALFFQFAAEGETATKRLIHLPD